MISNQIALALAFVHNCWKHQILTSGGRRVASGIHLRKGLLYIYVFPHQVGLDQV